MVPAVGRADLTVIQPKVVLRGARCAVMGYTGSRCVENESRTPGRRWPPERPRPANALGLVTFFAKVSMLFPRSGSAAGPRSTGARGSAFAGRDTNRGRHETGVRPAFTPGCELQPMRREPDGEIIRTEHRYVTGVFPKGFRMALAIEC